MTPLGRQLARAAPLLAALLLAAAQPDLDNLNAYIRSKFPDVPTVTTAQLAAELADPSRPTLTLLDVRSTEEFAVSHLTHALLVDPTDPLPASVADLPRDAPIVTYCSVGYRSAQLAESLLARRFTNVRNLEGSIFQWANEGRPLVSKGKATRAAHPYNKMWGRYLDRSHHAKQTN